MPYSVAVSLTFSPSSESLLESRSRASPPVNYKACPLYRRANITPYLSFHPCHKLKRIKRLCHIVIRSERNTVILSNCDLARRGRIIVCLLSLSFSVALSPSRLRHHYIPEIIHCRSLSSAVFSACLPFSAFPTLYPSRFK